jgi:hypothetical protein
MCHLHAAALCVILSLETAMLTPRRVLLPLLSLLLALSTLGTRAEAQYPELQTGTTIRMRGPQLAGSVRGIIIARSGDSLTVARANASPVTVAIPLLNAVDIFRGKSRGRGALRGALWGAGVGALLGLIPADETECELDPAVPGCGSVAESVALTAFGGAALGSVIGVAIGVEHWDTMPIRVSTGFGRGTGAMVRVSLHR